MVMENYPPDWEKRRYTVFKRDDFKCRGCEYIPDEKDGSELHAHHVKPISEGGGHSLDNLMTLCEDCHNEVHSSNQDPPLEPIEYYTCTTCGQEYPSHTSDIGGYCSKWCLAKYESKKSLNWVRENTRYCPTCFAYDPSSGACDNCGSWKPNESQRGECTDGIIRVGTLATLIFYHQNFGGEEVIGNKV